MSQQDILDAHPLGRFLEAQSSLDLDGPRHRRVAADGDVARTTPPVSFATLMEEFPQDGAAAAALEPVNDEIVFREVDSDADPHAQEVIDIELDSPRATIEPKAPALKEVLADRIHPPKPVFARPPPPQRSQPRPTRPKTLPAEPIAKKTPPKIRTPPRAAVPMPPPRARTPPKPKAATPPKKVYPATPGWVPPSPVPSDLDLDDNAQKHPIDDNTDYYRIANPDRVHDHKTARRRQSGGATSLAASTAPSSNDPFAVRPGKGMAYPSRSRPDSHIFPVSQPPEEEEEEEEEQEPQHVEEEQYEEEEEEDQQTQEEPEEEEGEAEEEQPQEEEQPEEEEAEEEEEEEEEDVRPVKDNTLRTAGVLYGPDLGTQLQDAQEQVDAEDAAESEADAHAASQKIAGDVFNAAMPANAQASTDNPAMKAKVDALVRITMLEKLGHRFERKFDLNSSADDMNAYADSVEKVASASRGLDTSRKMLIGFVGLVEYLNSQSPVQADLDGWSSDLMANIGEFDAVLLKIWQRMAANRSEQNPFVELALLLVLSGGAYHVTRKVVKDRSRRISERKKGTVVRAATSDLDSDGDEDLFSSSSSESESDSDDDDDDDDYARRQVASMPCVAPQGGFNPAQYVMAVQQPYQQPQQQQQQWVSPYPQQPQHTPYGYVQQPQVHTPVPSGTHTPVSAHATPSLVRRRPSPKHSEEDELLGTPSPVVSISRTASVLDDEPSDTEAPQPEAEAEAEAEPEPEPEPKATPSRSKKGRSTKRKKKRSSSKRNASDEQ